MAVRLRFSLAADSVPAVWRQVAKDGADLPAAQSKPGPAAIVLSVGETADAAFLATAPGTYRLTVGPPGGPVIWSQAVNAR